jgi:hypothetical protein
MEAQKIKFKDLSNWLKVAIISMWVCMGYLALSILVGIILAIIDFGV